MKNGLRKYRAVDSAETKNRFSIAAHEPLEIASRFPLSHSYGGDDTFPLTIVITFCKILLNRQFH